jgi:uncharacterized YccA/Bax inhibitor family protein
MADLIRTSNPALNAKTFQGNVAAGDVMTLQGTVNKTGFLLLCVVATASVTWHLAATGNPAVVALLALGAIGGFITAMVTIFKKTWSPVTAPLYALLEGLVLGAISALLEKAYPGIAIQAVGLTFGVLFCLLFAYSSRMIRVTAKFRLGVVAATGAIAVTYLVDMVLHFFGIQIPFIHQSGFWGIAFSVVVVIIASLNLVLDFDFIESGTQSGAPKYMEWYGAFGLMVTLIWLYLEILRLLSKLRDR